jgi:eukaryotic-like serine/threonine-protein kinase
MSQKHIPMPYASSEAVRPSTSIPGCPGPLYNRREFNPGVREEMPMLTVFECVAQAIKNKGIRGLCDLVPGGPYLFDVMGDALRLLRERRREKELREDLAKIAAASTDEAKKAAEEVARKVVAEAKPEAKPDDIADRITLELYRSQIPGAVRASLKRTDDPSGKTVPPDFAVNSPEDLARLMPQRVPHFRPGADLPGRPGWKLEGLLGAGGFGEVWLARHRFIPHPRAVKFCTDPLVRTKLTSHEGRVIARVMGQGNHPDVVPLLDAVLDRKRCG